MEKNILENRKYSKKLENDLQEISEVSKNMVSTIRTLELDNEAYQNQMQELREEIKSLKEDPSRENVQSYKSISLSPLNLINSIKSSKINSSHNIKQKQRKILILGDEMGLNLNNLIRKLLNLEEYRIESFIKPGGNFNNVIENLEEKVKEFNLKDLVIIIAGHNDFEMNNIPKFKNIVTKLKMCSHTNVLFLSSPILARNNKKSIIINKFNKHLLQFVTKLNLYTEGKMSFLNINTNRGFKSKQNDIASKIVNGIANYTNTSKNLIFILTNDTLPPCYPNTQVIVDENSSNTQVIVNENSGNTPVLVDGNSSNTGNRNNIDTSLENNSNSSFLEATQVEQSSL